MATTPFSTIFQRFLNKITDPDLASLLPDNLDSILTDFLQSSVVRFQKCRQDINDFDLTLKQFNVALNPVEIEILAMWMLYEWTSQQVYRSELLKQSLSSKDFAMYSQANHLDKVTVLKDSLYIEVNQMVTDYSYSQGLDDLA